MTPSMVHVTNPSPGGECNLTSRTPALRALALEPYQVLLPETWKEAPVSNARSGNYCQPRCDEVGLYKLNPGDT
jgi:hypothetical protein